MVTPTAHFGLAFVFDREFSVHPHRLSPSPSESLGDHIPRVRMHARRCPQARVLTISGDVDAANGERVQDFVTRYVLSGEALILDLSGIVFFGARGISVLTAVRDATRTADAPWALVPSRVVSRVLRLTACDTELPSADSVRDALRLITDAGTGSR
jgi:anti-anti-sigma factor